MRGKGVKKNHKRAVSLLKRAAAKKHPAAEYDLAVAYELGKGGLPKDPKAALMWYRRAANDGDRDAQAELARCYYHGIGTSANLSKAIRWYKKAATGADAEAQYALGRAFELGEGVAQDMQAALRWYRRAATQGDEDARKAIAEIRSALS